MKLIINNSSLINYYRLSDDDYEVLVNKFLRYLRNEYISEIMRVYRLDKYYCNNLVVICSRSRYYEIGIMNPDNYTNDELKLYSLKILSNEYGSRIKSSHPIIRKYCNSMNSNIREIWINFSNMVVNN